MNIRFLTSYKHSSGVWEAKTGDVLDIQRDMALPLIEQGVAEQAIDVSKLNFNEVMKHLETQKKSQTIITVPVFDLTEEEE